MAVVWLLPSRIPMVNMRPIPSSGAGDSQGACSPFWRTSIDGGMFMLSDLCVALTSV
jgi:hypothetical protein